MNSDTNKEGRLNMNSDTNKEGRLNMNSDINKEGSNYFASSVEPNRLPDKKETTLNTSPDTKLRKTFSERVIDEKTQKDTLDFYGGI